MNNLYNEHIKEEFLKTYDNLQTQNTIRYILFKSYSIENFLNKDLYNFNIQELGQVVLSTNPLNAAVAKTNIRFIKQYLKWASDKGLRTSNISPLDGLDVNVWVEQFVPKRKIYFSETEVSRLESHLVNYQDKAIIRMLFEFGGGYGTSEICNLRSSDINRDECKLKLNDVKFEPREVEVSKVCMDLIVGADAELQYEIRNGTIEKGNKVIDLVSNDYVIRPINRKVSDESSPADKHTLYRRLSTISEILEIPYLTAKNLARSGMLHMAKNIYLEKGELEYSELEKIAERYSIQKVYVNGYHTYNTTIIREYINMKNILELYPEINE